MALIRLLAATDFSKRSNLAMARAGILAGTSCADLLLLHVVDDDLPKAVSAENRRIAEVALNSLAEELAGQLKGKSTCRIAEGDPSEMIVEAAQAFDADLVVMGGHRKRLLQDIFVGTTVERVMRTGHRPVLMVKTALNRPYRRIMVALDMSPASARALNVVGDLGLFDGAYLTLLHVFEPFAKVMMIYAGIEREAVEEHVDHERTKAERALTQFLAGQNLKERDYEVRLLEGHVFHSIQKTLAAEKPDLLVIGTRGLTGAGRMLLGSVADALLRDAQCDVLAVPPA